MCITRNCIKYLPCKMNIEFTSNEQMYLSLVALSRWREVYLQVAYVPFCRSHNPVLLSWFMTYHRILTSVTRRVPLVEQWVAVYPSGASEFDQVFSAVRVSQLLLLYVVFCGPLFVICSFHCKLSRFNYIMYHTR